MRIRLACLLALVAVPIVSFAEPLATTQPVATTRPAVADTGLLRDWLTGHFSSLAQSKSDIAYFDIHLHSSVIWPDRVDGPWIYVEQARGDLLDQPYRQRVYQLRVDPDGTFVSEVYELPGKPDDVVTQFAGAWKDATKLAAVTPQQLLLKPGCGVFLTYADGTFTGGTRGNGCLSSLRGAHHATSEVVINAAGLKTWDRGFDEAGTQKWGATAGPYLFDRVGE
jgi:hypothetical protein